jgi:hypothetical protein
VDEEFLSAALDFIDRQHQANTPTANARWPAPPADLPAGGRPPFYRRADGDAVSSGGSFIQ